MKKRAACLLKLIHFTNIIHHFCLTTSRLRSYSNLETSLHCQLQTSLLSTSLLFHLTSVPTSVLFYLNSEPPGSCSSLLLSSNRTKLDLSRLPPVPGLPDELRQTNWYGQDLDESDIEPYNPDHDSRIDCFGGQRTDRQD